MPVCGVPLILRRCSVHPSTPHSSGEFILSLSKEALPRTGFRKPQLAPACLREAASAKAGAFLSTPFRMTSLWEDASQAFERVITDSDSVHLGYRTHSRDTGGDRDHEGAESKQHRIQRGTHSTRNPPKRDSPTVGRSSRTESV